MGSRRSPAAFSCAPPKGTTYLTIGQDLFSIEEYVLSQYNASLHSLNPQPMQSFYPAAFMFYTDLEKLRGLSKPIDYGSGVEYADGVLNSLFAGYDVGIQIGLWLGGAEGCRSVNNGMWDNQIDELIDYLVGCSASKVFLRLGYEFDNPWFYYSSAPREYAKAYQRVASAIRKSPAKSKVIFVWHSWAAPREAPLQHFWPGTEYVDWIGVSIFQQLYPWSQESSWAGGSLGDVLEVLEFAAKYDKPTMIAESTPYGGIDMETNDTLKYNMTDPWDRWFASVLALIDEYDIKMWSYINCDWESQPMWNGVGFGESRISSNVNVMRNWQDIIVGLKGHGRRKFLMAGSLKNCGAELKSHSSRSSSAHSSVLGLASKQSILSTKDMSVHGALSPIVYACIALPLVLSIFTFGLRRQHLYGDPTKLTAATTKTCPDEETPMLSS